MENYGAYRCSQCHGYREQFYDEPMMQSSYNDDMMQESYNDQRIGGQPYNDQMIGEPYSVGTTDQSYDDQMVGQPYYNQMNGQSDNDQMIGQSHTYNPISTLEPSAEPTPYYQMYGYPQMLMEEQENDLDMDRLKEMYPETARYIMSFVEDECDKLEYEGSFMFDEHPDVTMLVKIRNDIYGNVKDNFDMEAKAVKEGKSEENEKDEKDDVYGMNWERSRRFPPNKNWLGDTIDILLLGEMFRRRCRFRNCCGRWC